MLINLNENNNFNGNYLCTAFSEMEDGFFTIEQLENNRNQGKGKYMVPRQFLSEKFKSLRLS